MDVVRGSAWYAGALAELVKIGKVAPAMVVLLHLIPMAPVHAEAIGDCSWTGPEPEWILDRPLPAVDLTGSLVPEVIKYLHAAGAPISAISRAEEDSEIRIQRPPGMTIRELLDEVMRQAPGYRLETVSGRLVIYPSGGAYDAVIELGEVREVKRAGAQISVVRELRSRSSPLPGLGTVLRGPFFGTGDLIPFGGTRSVVEHLVSVTAGSPSIAFAVAPSRDGKMYFSLLRADVIEDFLLEVPEKVEVGEEFQAVPRVILTSGETVTLLGPECGVEYHSTDEAILKVDRRGHAVAVGAGRDGIYAIYEAIRIYAKVEVTGDADGAEHAPY